MKPLYTYRKEHFSASQLRIGFLCAFIAEAYYTISIWRVDHQLEDSHYPWPAIWIGFAISLLILFYGLWTAGRNTFSVGFDLHDKHSVLILEEGQKSVLNHQLKLVFFSLPGFNRGTLHIYDGGERPALGVNGLELDQNLSAALQRSGITVEKNPWPILIILISCILFGKTENPIFLIGILFANFLFKNGRRGANTISKTRLAAHTKFVLAIVILGSPLLPSSILKSILQSETSIELADHQFKQGNFKEGIQVLEQELQIKRSGKVLDALAWALTTHPDPQERNYSRAVELSEESLKQLKDLHQLQSFAEIEPIIYSNTYICALFGNHQENDAIQRAKRMGAKRRMNDFMAGKGCEDRRYAAFAKPVDVQRAVSSVTESQPAPNLSQEQLKYLEVQFQLATQKFDEGKLPEAKIEASKIFSLVKDYKNIRSRYEKAFGPIKETTSSPEVVQAQQGAALKKEAHPLTEEQRNQAQSLYSKCFDAYKVRNYAEAITLADQVIAIDPQFRNIQELRAFSIEGARKLKAQADSAKHTQ